MNKIEINSTDETNLVNLYKSYVLKDTRSKLAFVIFVIARKQRIINEIEIIYKSFSLKGLIIDNDLTPGARKTFLNLLFNDKNKIKNSNSIEYSKIGRKNSYKKSFSSYIFDIDSFVLLYSHLEDLITKRLTSFEIKTLLTKLIGKLKSTQDQIILDFVFDYPKYFHQTKSNTSYFGVKLAKALFTNVCVYCNREYISTILGDNEKKHISPAFDHFLSQSEYPYMAISLFNLIPSCYSCNSQLKHNKPFNINDYLYPFEDSYEGKAEFKTYWNKSFLSTEIPEAELVNVNDLKIEIKPIYTPEPKIFGDLSLPQNERKGNIKVFQTELVYDSIHRDSVLEVITQFRVHSKKDIESLKTSYTFIKNDADVYQFYFKNYLDEKDFNKRPLSRMTRDIAMQINVIYNLFI